MQIKCYNAPEPRAYDSSILSPETPAFVSYEPDWKKLESLQTEFVHYKNILIIAHGGSITTFYGMYYALIEKVTKQAYFLNTVDPDYIRQLKGKLTPQDTLVIAISKSGENVTQLEALMQFLDYPLLFIASPGNPLAQIAEKRKGRLFEHPPIGGRYTGLTEVALVPAAICGLDIHELYNGGKYLYDQYPTDNLARKAADVVWQLEQKDYVGVFMPIYSHAMFPFEQLIVQLCHESFGKAGKGQSYLAFEAPEAQHHTTQRFFGGRKNMLGFFIGVDHSNYDTVTVIPDDLQDIKFKEHTLGALDKIPLSISMGSELVANLEHAIEEQIPTLHAALTDRSEKTIGEFIAFWQLYAMYSSLLRNVNPFDQPEVEASKIISFKKRLMYKGAQ